MLNRFPSGLNPKTQGSQYQRCTNLSLRGYVGEEKVKNVVIETICTMLNIKGRYRVNNKTGSYHVLQENHRAKGGKTDRLGYFCVNINSPRPLLHERSLNLLYSKPP